MAEPDSIPELRPIPGFRGYYASRCGWIWSTWRRVPGKRNEFLPDAKCPTRLSCPIARHKNFKGYRQVKLKDNGRLLYNGPIHRLILFAFVGQPPEGKPECAHENGDSYDNRLENLSWKSQLDNNRDRIRHGTVPRLLGEASPQHKLTTEQVKEIRRRYAAGGIPQWKLAKEFGLHQVTVSEIILRKIWSHI